MARLLAFVTGMVNQQILLQHEYLIAENRILRAQLPGRLRLTDAQRSALAEIGKRLGRSALGQVASIAKPETILGWYRKLIARKFDGSKHRLYPGRPAVGHEVTELVVRMARENSGWGYDRIEESRSLRFGSDGRQYLAPPCYRPGAETSSANDLGGLHSISHGCAGGYRFLHRGSTHLAQPRYILRTVLLALGHSAGHHRRHHQTAIMVSRQEWMFASGAKGRRFAEQRIAATLERESWDIFRVYRGQQALFAVFDTLSENLSDLCAEAARDGMTQSVA